MKDASDLFKWLLERNIRARNAASLLVGLLSVVAFYFTSRQSEWFKDVERYGPIGVLVALVVVFLIAFLAASLASSGLTTYYERVVSHRQSERQTERQEICVRDNLDSLTDWQRRFLLRFIVERKRQIPDFQVGQFRAVWEPEMRVLIEKGIVREHRRAGVYEIEPIYHDYLAENWNPDTGTLK